MTPSPTRLRTQSSGSDFELPSFKQEFNIHTSTLLQLFIRHAALSHKATFFGLHTLSEEEKVQWIDVVLAAEAATGYPVRNSLIAPIAKALGLADAHVSEFFKHCSRGDGHPPLGCK